jgi:hypothetical protein
LTILAAIVPDAPTNTSSQQNKTSSTLKWNLPNEHGAAVLQYQILIKNSNGVFVETSVCDGTN